MAGHGSVVSDAAGILREPHGMDTHDALMMGRTTDGRTVQRPMSPHLQIYRPQITSAMSIFHRITGVALSAGTLVLVWWLAAAATSDRAFATASWFIGSWLGILMLFGWTAALWYHFCAGIRHLFWDAGYGYDLPQVHASGRAAIVAAAVLTVITWLFVFIAI
jgi:succinate dehydrogenase / fumarate reductase cytochrome b subunit